MRLPVAVLVALGLAACSSSNSGSEGFVHTGGTTGAGSGGTNGSGGTTGTGGANGTGGATSSGGTTGATGGGTASGGNTSAGGNSLGTGGSGGAQTGSGGTQTGSGGTPQGGSSGATGGAGGGASSTTMSAGCGMTPPAASGMIGTTQFGQFSITITAQSYNSYSQPAAPVARTYYVRLPNNYDNTKPYRVIYLGPGCGQAQSTLMTPKGLPIDSDPMTQGATGAASNAIIVQLEQGTYNPAEYNPANCRPGDTSGCTSTSAYCFDDWAYVPANTIPDGPASAAMERAYFDALHKSIEGRYCVDKTRQFYAGYSSGGWLAQQLGCWFPDVLRAQANVTGGLPPDIKTNSTAANDYCVKHPIAAFLIHDALDGTPAVGGNPFSGSVDAATRLFALNGCTGMFATPPRPDSTAPLPAGLALYTITGVPNNNNFRCYQYTTCPAANPMYFCVSIDGMHNDQHARADPAFWEFFSKL
jgi:hypothetical protein